MSRIPIESGDDIVWHTEEEYDRLWNIDRQVTDAMTADLDLYILDEDLLDED